MQTTSPPAANSSTPTPPPDPIDIRKRTAEAATAEATAEQTKQAARSAKIKADADQRTENEAQASTLANLVPDISKVERGKTEATGDALFAGAVTIWAMNAAAKRIGRELNTALKDLPTRPTVLVTTDADLATSDSSYWEVKTQLDSLNAATENLLTVAAHPDPDRADADDRRPILPILAATKLAAAAIPQLLQMTSSVRTITGTVTTADDLAAAASVLHSAGREHADFVLDNLRVIPQTRLQKKLKLLQQNRNLLGELRETWNQDLTRATRVRTASDDQVKLYDTQILAAINAKTSPDALLTEREKHASERDDQASAETEAGTRVAQLDTVIKAVDAFVSYLTTTPAGQLRSPLAAAALRAELHGEHPRFTHILLVKGMPGSANQLIDDRPFFLRDRFSTVAATSLIYVLSDLAGNVRHSGVIPAIATINGEIGKKIEPTSITAKVQEPN